MAGLALTCWLALIVSVPFRRRWSGAGGETRDETACLSHRELQVLGLLAQGLTNCQIADKLAISQRTVDHHVGHILAKLDVPNRTAAAVVAAHQADLSG